MDQLSEEGVISHQQQKISQSDNVKNGLVIEEIPGCRMKGNYVNGKKCGKWTLDYTDRIEEGEFEGKFKVGEWVVTYKDKQLIEQGQYDKLNLRTGEWTQREFQLTDQYFRLTYKLGKVQRKVQVDYLILHSQLITH